MHPKTSIKINFNMEEKKCSKLEEEAKKEKS